MLTTWRSALRARSLHFRQEILASLGDVLAIDRHVASVEGLKEAHLGEFGVTEFDEVSLLEADDRGRFLRSEIFAPDRLGDAIARLYELYAELLPDGPERNRAAATARSVATMLRGSFDPVRYASRMAPAVQIVDHRILGMFSANGAEAALQNLDSLFNVSDDNPFRVDDVLRLERDALLSRAATCGTDRAGGGAFERPMVAIQIFGADGLLTRIEVFDVE